jgi:VanZ family protein
MALLSPTQDLPKVSIKYADKVVHFGIHYILVLFWLAYFHYKNSQDISTSQILLVLLGVLLYGILIEVMQASMTNGRSGDPFDVLANSIGLFAGFSTFRIFQKKIL